MLLQMGLSLLVEFWGTLQIWTYNNQIYNSLKILRMKEKIPLIVFFPQIPDTNTVTEAILLFNFCLCLQPAL